MNKDGVCMICKLEVRKMAEKEPSPEIDICEDPPETEDGAIVLQSDGFPFTMSKHKAVLLDPKMAERYLHLNTYTAQRKVKKHLDW